MIIRILILLIMIPCFVFSGNGFVSGFVKSEKGEALPFSTVYVSEVKKGYSSDINGYFTTDLLPYGKYTIVVSFIGFAPRSEKIVINNSTTRTDIYLKEKESFLPAVSIVGEKKSIGTTRKLNAIEGTMITQGKKNEVIKMDEVAGNKAANVSRQIYSRIPGLNIWESDGAGLQLGIGGRGLNPSRTSNYNTRQNGYDISADALGYPESYYTPPSEALKEIQLIRGAASLQFGPHFGGLLNFVTKTGADSKKLETTYRATTGSFGFQNHFLSFGGTIKKWNYYAYAQYKFGDDFRPNSQFNSYASGINISKELGSKAKLGLELTKTYYLAQQPGGLTDLEFYENAAQSKRTRNWFRVNWNLAAVNLDYKLSNKTKLNTKFFGLLASREALGILGRIDRVDDLTENRDLIFGEWKNWGNETRVLHKYAVKEKPWAFVTGFRYYEGYSLSEQGKANNKSTADFNYISKLEGTEQYSHYEFPSKNISVFAENLMNIGNGFSITPGIRFEHINTNANGVFKQLAFNNAGTPIIDTNLTETRNSIRNIVIAGIGLNYRFSDSLEIYANISQNYRSINFTDMQIINPNFRIDPNLQDETGFNADLGAKGVIGTKLGYDASLFGLFYNNRIGTVQGFDPNTFVVFRNRTNISQSLAVGIEAMAELDVSEWIYKDSSDFKTTIFTNFSYIKARYLNSQESAFENKQVELVPPYNIKTGFTFSYKKASLSYQYSYIAKQFTDATNADLATSNALFGAIPAYSIMDVSFKYTWKKLQLETGINNLSNSIYFTRRATGYPGPGVLPAQPRNYFVTLQIKI